MKNVIQVILLFIFLPFLRCRTLCSQPCSTPGSPPNICYKCIDGCYLDSKTNNCYKCNANCRKCNSTNCQLCGTGYFIYYSICLVCHYNCKTNYDNDYCKCQTCNEGYFLNAFRCLKCSTNCETCSGTDTNCSSCYDGYYLNSDRICKQCTSQCKTSLINQFVILV